MTKSNFNINNFLENNVKPALGCTEPVTVGYAVSVAYHALFGDLPSDDLQEKYHAKCKCPKPKDEKLKEINIKTDRDVFKNAKAVIIPKTNGQKGIAIAAAMGLYCNPYNGQELFKEVTQDTINAANKIIENKKVNIEKVVDTNEKVKIDIRVVIKYANDTAIVEIKDKHFNIVNIEVNKEIVYTKNQQEQTTSKNEEVYDKLPDNLMELIDIVRTRRLTSEEKEKVYKGIEMNKKMAKEGLKNNYGLKYGKRIKDLRNQGVLDDSIITEVRIQAAAAGDARMGGADMSVMGTAGSGNQGITALIPILVVGGKVQIKNKKEKMCEAALLSHLVTEYVSKRSGYLSAICGCAIKAGIGAAAGVAYLLGGNEIQINNAINIMAANLTGVICDGAKEGCALKLSNAAGVATESAYMALNGMEVPPDNGIVDKKAENTIENIGIITKTMVPTDVEIVRIMENKNYNEV